MNTKLLTSIIGSVASSMLLFACSNTSKNMVTPPPAQNDSATLNLGVWVPQATFLGSGRAYAVAFTIGNYAYVGTGKNGNSADTALSDFYKYDPTANTWTQISSIPQARYAAVAFAINGKGYVGTGLVYRPTPTLLSDFWAYNPLTDSWTRKADIPGGGRDEATAFAIGNTGYVLCGNTSITGENPQKDMYDYDPASDTWTTDGFLGNKREGATAFVYNNEAYVVGGEDGGLLSDFYKFNPATHLWTQLRHIANNTDSTWDDNYTSIERGNAVSFVVGDTAYLASGNVTPMGNDYNKSTWAYDFKKDLWRQHAPLPIATVSGIGFTLNNNAYLGLGMMLDSTGNFSFLDTIFKFYPDSTAK